MVVICIFTNEEKTISMLIIDNSEHLKILWTFDKQDNLLICRSIVVGCLLFFGPPHIMAYTCMIPMRKVGLAYFNCCQLITHANITIKIPLIAGHCKSDNSTPSIIFYLQLKFNNYKSTILCDFLSQQ